MQPPAALKNTSCAADHSALTPFPQADIIYSINLFSRFGGIVTKYRYLIHPLKFAAALFTVVACTFLAILAATFRNWIMLLLFTVAAAVFVWVCVLYGSVLTLDAQGLVLRFCGFTLRTVNWSEVAEVGVVGLKVFNNNDPKHTGTRYIYFSPHRLDKDSRFRLGLEWPPRDMLYLCYTKERLNAVQSLSSGTVETFNAGDVFF